MYLYNKDQVKILSLYSTRKSCGYFNQILVLCRRWETSIKSEFIMQLTWGNSLIVAYAYVRSLGLAASTMNDDKTSLVKRVECSVCSKRRNSSLSQPPSVGGLYSKMFMTLYTLWQSVRKRQPLVYLLFIGKVTLPKKADIISNKMIGKWIVFLSDWIRIYRFFIVSQWHDRNFISTGIQFIFI